MATIDTADRYAPEGKAGRLAWTWNLGGLISPWLLLLVLAPIAAAATAYAISVRQPKVFEAKGTIIVQSLLSSGATYSDVLANQQLSKTYSQLILASPVLDEVAKQTGVTSRELRDRISASQRADTQLIDIKAEDTDPAKAAQIATTTAQVFADQTRQANLDLQSFAAKELDAQVAATQANINQRELTIANLSTPLSAGPAETDRQQRLVEERSRLESDRSNLSAVQNAQQQLRLEAIRKTSNVSVANPASVPEGPVRPRVKLNTVLAGMLGFVLAVPIIVLASRPLRLTLR